MDSHEIVKQINQGKRPEPTAYDTRRHESMRLRPNGLYGIPKFQFNKEKIFPGTCEKCVFDIGDHICGR